MISSRETTSFRYRVVNEVGRTIFFAFKTLNSSSRTSAVAFGTLARWTAGSLPAIPEVNACSGALVFLAGAGVDGGGDGVVMDVRCMMDVGREVYRIICLWS